MENEFYHCNNCGLDFIWPPSPDLDPDEVVECPRCHSGNVNPPTLTRVDE